MLYLRARNIAVASLSTSVCTLFIPSFSGASEGPGLFFVAAWLIRLALGLIGGTAVVVGVMMALNGYAPEPTIEPVASPESGVTIVQKRKLSYRRIGGGLLSVIFGCALFLAVVFLLPDRRTGYSGIGKLLGCFQAIRGETVEVSQVGGVAAGDAPPGTVR